MKLEQFLNEVLSEEYLLNKKEVKEYILGYFQDLSQITFFLETYFGVTLDIEVKQIKQENNEWNLKGISELINHGPKYVETECQTDDGVQYLKTIPL